MNRRPRIRVIGRCTALLLGTMLAACQTLPVGAGFDHSVSFGAYHTFAVLPGASSGYADASVGMAARVAIEHELLLKGFSTARDVESADFVVDFRLAAQDRTQVRTYPPPYEGRWWSLQDWWVHPESDYALDMRPYREGTLVIDVVDAHSHALLWHGWARRELRDWEVRHPGGRIRAAVRAILKRFPPQ